MFGNMISYIFFYYYILKACVMIRSPQKSNASPKWPVKPFRLAMPATDLFLGSSSSFCHRGCCEQLPLQPNRAEIWVLRLWWSLASWQVTAPIFGEYIYKKKLTSAGQMGMRSPIWECENKDCPCLIFSSSIFQRTRADESTDNCLKCKKWEYNKKDNAGVQTEYYIAANNQTPMPHQPDALFNNQSIKQKILGYCSLSMLLLLLFLF